MTTKPPSPEITERGPAALGSAVAPVATASSRSFSPLLALVLVSALALALAIVGIAVTPSRALPRAVGMVVYERRDSLIYVGIATALSIGLGLLITLAGT
jgi:hypothetical protein